jgi:hypothetical protein
MSSGKFLILTMNCFFLFAFLTIIYFVNTILTGHRHSPRIKGKSPEREEMKGVEEQWQPEFEVEEQEGSPESNSGDSSYNEESSMDEVVQRSSTPVAGIKKTIGEYDTPIVSFVEGKGNSGNKSKSKISSNESNNTVIRNSGKYVFLFVVFFFSLFFPNLLFFSLFWQIICFPLIYSTF